MHEYTSYSLQPVHHGSIIAVGGGSDEEKEDDQVESTEMTPVESSISALEELVEFLVGVLCTSITLRHGVLHGDCTFEYKRESEREGDQEDEEKRREEEEAVTVSLTLFLLRIVAQRSGSQDR